MYEWNSILWLRPPNDMTRAALTSGVFKIFGVRKWGYRVREAGVTEHQPDGVTMAFLRHHRARNVGEGWLCLWTQFSKIYTAEASCFCLNEKKIQSDNQTGHKQTSRLEKTGTVSHLHVLHSPGWTEVFPFALAQISVPR